MTSDELWDPASLFEQCSSEEEAHTRLVSSVKINQDTVCCNPDEPQSEHDDPESDQLLVDVSSSLALETMLPLILSSVRVATYLPETPQDISQNVSAIRSIKTRHSVVSPEELSKKWRVGVNTARQTLKTTTQRGIRTAVQPPTRRHCTNHFSLRHRCLDAQFYSDTKSLKGNKCAQVFAAKDFIGVHPMNSKQECAQALQVFAEDIGIPANLCADGAAELTGLNSDRRKL
jgi:hypothetical protein